MEGDKNEGGPQELGKAEETVLDPAPPAGGGSRELGLSQAEGHALRLPSTQRGNARSATHVLVAVGRAGTRALTLHYAAAVAHAAEARVTLVQVLEPPADSFHGVPVDAFEWELVRSECEEELRADSERLREQGLSVSAQLLVGRPVEQLLAHLQRDRVDLIVVGSHERIDDLEPYLSSTVDRLIELSGASVLVVPAGAEDLPDSRAPELGSILVPLDGSSRAECALPLAVDLARKHGAELILVHAAPGAKLTPAPAYRAEDEELLQRIRDRNLEIGKAYVGRLQHRLEVDGVVTRAVVESSTDTRRALSEIIAREPADLIIASADGCTAARPVGYGSVARNLARHAKTPLIIVRGSGSGAPHGHVHAQQAARPHFHEETQT